MAVRPLTDADRDWARSVIDFVDVVRRSKPTSAGYRDAIELEWPCIIES